MDEELSKSAGLVLAEIRQKEKDFDLADSYLLATARNLKTKILTGDPHFKNVTDAAMIK